MLTVGINHVTLYIATMTKSSMWGGRFQTAQDDILTQINASIDVDKRFYLEDITGSKAHAAMLHSTGILNDQDFSQINTGLDTIQSEIEAGTFTFSAKLEDIHMNIESRLKDLIGDAAGRLHTGRSRNDQVATDFRLWLRSATESLINEIITVQKALLQQAHDHTDTAMPGFTHLQVAQPVTFGHHLMAYVEMLQRDKTRFQDSLKRLNQSPLGAAALAGTSYKIDRHQTAAALGFDGPMNNSLDAVSARDFAQEFLAATSICACHLSRLAEEMVTWMTPAFGFISLSDAWTTGSSIMPQKRNPDAAELVRGKSGRIFGNLQSLLVTVKGLPLAYSKDLQEDKEPVFDSFDALYLCLKSTAGMVTDMIVHKQNMAKMANAGFSTATDLADFLVQTYNLPFRDAHHVTGSIVKLAEEKNCLLEDLPLSGMQTIFPKLDDTIFSVLKVDEALKRRHSFGGTAPKNVQQAIIQAKQDYDL